MKLGGLLGAILAVAALFAFTEWLFVDTFASDLGDALEVVITAVVAAAGWLVGSRLARRIICKRPRPA